MTPDRLAELHALAMHNQRAWSSSEFAELLSNPTIETIVHPHGFLMLRQIEADIEILTLVVDPECQNQGIATRLMMELTERATLFAPSRVFLEVSSQNLVAIKLYSNQGFNEIGTRKAYYTKSNGESVDALILEKRVNSKNSQ